MAPPSIVLTSLDSVTKSSDSFIPTAIPQVGRVHGSAEFWFFTKRTTDSISVMLKSLKRITNIKPKTVAKITLLTYELQHLQKLLQTLADNHEKVDTKDYGSASISMRSSNDDIASSLSTDITQRDSNENINE